MKAHIDKMSFDIEEQLLVKTKNSSFYALQCDDSTDVSQCWQQLPTDICSIFGRGQYNKIRAYITTRIGHLDPTSKGPDVMKIISDFFFNEVIWEKFAGFFIGGYSMLC